MTPASLLERVVRRFDDIQLGHRWLAQPIGVIRKYADDRGSAFSGLVTFQVFLGLLPLLVIALTVFGRILENSDSVREAVLDSTVVQFPVVGQQIEDNLSGLTVDGWWVWVTLAGLLWTATGMYNSFQLALNQVWNVEGVDRQGFVSRLLRALILFTLVFAAAIGSQALRSVDALPDSGRLAELGSLVAGSIFAAVLLLGVFRIVVAPSVNWRLLVPAALLSGVAWEVLQRLGSWIVSDRLSQARNLYGAIGLVVVTLFWINLLARSVVLANEAAVVHSRRLWPRRIAQPPLTEADRRVLVGLIANERRRPEQTVVVSYSPGGSDDVDSEPERHVLGGDDEG